MSRTNVLLALLVCGLSAVSLPAQAQDDFSYPSDRQFQKFDYEAEIVFDSPAFKDYNQKYVNNSNADTRSDGIAQCVKFSVSPVGKVLDDELHEVDKNLAPQQYYSEISYIIGISIAATESICPQYDGEVFEYIQVLRLKSEYLERQQQHKNKAGSNH